MPYQLAVGGLQVCLDNKLRKFRSPEIVAASTCRPPTNSTALAHSPMKDMTVMGSLLHCLGLPKSSHYANRTELLQAGVAGAADVLGSVAKTATASQQHPRAKFVARRWYSGPLGYLIFSSMALIGDPIY